MSVELPDPLAERLAAEAARRGLAVEAIEGRYGIVRPEPKTDGVDAVEAFIGCFDSGDPEWASTDTHVLRAQAAAHRKH